jgi:hypothetical protein
VAVAPATADMVVVMKNNTRRTTINRVRAAKASAVSPQWTKNNNVKSHRVEDALLTADQEDSLQWTKMNKEKLLPKVDVRRIEVRVVLPRWMKMSSVKSLHAVDALLIAGHEVSRPWIVKNNAKSHRVEDKPATAVGEAIMMQVMKPVMLVADVVLPQWSRSNDGALPQEAAVHRAGIGREVRANYSGFLRGWSNFFIRFAPQEIVPRQSPQHNPFRQR